MLKINPFIVPPKIIQFTDNTMSGTLACNKSLIKMTDPYLHPLDPVHPVRYVHSLGNHKALADLTENNSTPYTARQIPCVIFPTFSLFWAVLDSPILYNTVGIFLVDLTFFVGHVLMLEYLGHLGNLTCTPRRLLKLLQSSCQLLENKISYITRML